METKKKMSTSELVEVPQGNSPAEMIRMAVTGGADLEKLKGLLDLQERWEANEARKAYHKAMAAFKENPPKIKKDKKVGYKPKDGGRDVSYKHASLANVVEKITKELSKHGLSASWRTQQNGQIGVTCRITHVMGHFEEVTLTAPSDTSGSKNSIQAIGSTITYLERYTLLAATGLATEDQDDDASNAVDELIDDKQLSTLIDMINATNTDQAKFLKFVKLEKLEDMTQKSYPKALSALKDKLDKEKKC